MSARGEEGKGWPVLEIDGQVVGRLWMRDSHAMRLYPISKDGIVVGLTLAPLPGEPANENA